MVEEANSYTEFSYDANTLTILCHGIKPAGFRHFGSLNDGTKIEMYDQDYFVRLRGVSFGTNNDVPLRQNEINEICEKYLDRKCPIVGTDGALEGIMAAVLQYSDMREAFDKYWKKRLAVRRKEWRENESPLPPEFAAALDAMQHLLVCRRTNEAR
jgi:primase-polymerase (primpol)-like protein